MLMIIFKTSDIDECRISMVDICTPGRCVNEPGTFRCECNEGYKGIMMNQMCVGKFTLFITLFFICFYKTCYVSKLYMY